MKLINVVFIIVFVFKIQAEELTATTYPNPRTNYQECGMRSSSYVCDPYETLTESERYRINNQLIKFMTQTEEGGNSFCGRKGTEVFFIIINQASEKISDELRRKMNYDAQCGQFGILVLSLADRKMYGSFDERSPINSGQFEAVIATNDENIQTGSYTTAVLNILKEVASKQDPLSLTTQRPPSGPTKSALTPISVLFIIIVASFLYLF